MTHEEIKNEFLSNLPDGFMKKLNPASTALLDEAIDRAAKGDIKIGDRIPETKEERFVCIGEYLTLGIQGLIALTAEAKKLNNENMNINLFFKGIKIN